MTKDISSLVPSRPSFFSLPVRKSGFFLLEAKKARSAGYEAKTLMSFGGHSTVACEQKYGVMRLRYGVSCCNSQCMSLSVSILCLSHDQLAVGVVFIEAKQGCQSIISSDIFLCACKVRLFMLCQK